MSLCQTGTGDFKSATNSGFSGTRPGRPEPGAREPQPTADSAEIPDWTAASRQRRTVGNAS